MIRSSTGKVYERNSVPDFGFEHLPPVRRWAVRTVLVAVVAVLLLAVLIMGAIGGALLAAAT